MVSVASAYVCDGWRWFRMMFPRLGFVECATLFLGCGMLTWWLVMGLAMAAFLARGGF